MKFACCMNELIRIKPDEHMDKMVAHMLLVCGTWLRKDVEIIEKIELFCPVKCSLWLLSILEKIEELWPKNKNQRFY